MNGDGRVGVFPRTVGDGGGRGCLGASLLHSRDPSSDPAGVGFFALGPYFKSRDPNSNSVGELLLLC